MGELNEPRLRQHAIKRIMFFSPSLIFDLASTDYLKKNIANILMHELAFLIHWPNSALGMI